MGDVQKATDGQRADLVFTDPPYGMGKESDGVQNDNQNQNDLLEFNKKWIALSFSILKETGAGTAGASTSRSWIFTPSSFGR